MTATTRDDTPVAFRNGDAELRMRDAGGEMSVSFVRFPKGTDMSPALQGLPGDLCPSPHWGYMLKGRIKLMTKDGDQTYGAGEAFYWAPGHAPVALEDCEYVDFTPTEEFTRVVAHVKEKTG
ncbi:hypothetical protein [uncultured Streptomyces sp.]|uniref:hypothetical protein n=1 Tax=uncultured Streptomyces sp. TaxID=174707 RepID=UPI00263537B7|nr:hypothetical protein [uncultured Streptomyces sp.]